MSENETPLTCAFHPKRETSLRCNRCGRPICIKCATHTPTGYRCPECIKSQQKAFVTTRWFDQIIAALITAPVSFLGSWLTVYLGFYTIFVALGAGLLAVWLVKKAIQNRRSPLLKFIMSAAAFIASLLPPALFWLGGGGFYNLIWFLGYSLIITVDIYYQLSR
jgi:hypothetical protein